MRGGMQDNSACTRSVACTRSGELGSTEQRSAGTLQAAHFAVHVPHTAAVWAVPHAMRTTPPRRRCIITLGTVMLLLWPCPSCLHARTNPRCHPNSECEKRTGTHHRQQAGFEINPPPLHTYTHPAHVPRLARSPGVQASWRCPPQQTKGIQGSTAAARTHAHSTAQHSTAQHSTR
jgi:hypothetical protein